MPGATARAKSESHPSFKMNESGKPHGEATMKLPDIWGQDLQTGDWGVLDSNGQWAVFRADEQTARMIWAEWPTITWQLVKNICINEFPDLQEEHDVVEERPENEPK